MWKSGPSAWLRMWRGVLQSDRFWAIASSMAARGAGFVIGMLLTRWQGVAVFGIYAATLNVAASAMSPLGQVMQNNAALLAARQEGVVARRRVVLVHLPLLAGLFALGLLLFAVLAPRSGLAVTWNDAGAWTWFAAACVIFFQLLNGTAQGFLYGAGDFVRPAQAVVALLSVTMALAWPLISVFGLSGAYMALALNSLLPPFVLLTLFLRAPASAPDEAGALPLTVSSRVVGRAFARSLPFVLTALSSSAVMWFCMVYLTNAAHGKEGLGWVSLGVQWGTLMLLPCTSWGGLVMKHVMDEVHANGVTGAGRTVLRLSWQSSGITLLTAVVAWCISPLLASMYRVDANVLASLLAVTALYALLTSVNGVYERWFFCVHHQIQWLVIAGGGAAVQVIVTMWALPHGITGVAAGMGAGALAQCLLASYWIFVRHAPHEH
jgi:O-antigen/teichoic acid export membrane protein